MTKFDSNLSNFCNENNIVYTRYADDLAFSTNTPNILSNLPSKIKELCKNISYPNALKVNAKKTIFTSKKHNRTLTGLIISNDGKIGIGRDKKRRLRNIAHKISLGLLPVEEVEKFKGTLAFLLSIDPDLSDYLRNKANL